MASNVFDDLIPKTQANSFADLVPAKKEDFNWKDLKNAAVDAGSGFVSSVQDTYLGLKDLTVGLDETDRQRQAQWKKAAERSGWGTGGRVIGELAQFAIPGSAGLKAAKALQTANKATKVAKALPLATDIAASAALSGVQLPEEGESRLENAITGGSAAAGGAVLGKALGLLGKGFKVSDEARRLQDMGVYLTPGQAIPALAKTERVMEITPFAARGTRNAIARAENAMHKKALELGAPQGTKITGKGHEGIRDIRSAVQKAYSEAWGTADALAPRTLPRVFHEGTVGARSLGKKDSGLIRRVQDDILKLTKDGSNIDTQKIDSVLRKAISGSPDAREVDGIIKRMRKTLRDGLPEESKAALAKIDEVYPKYLVLRKAAGSADGKKVKGVFGHKGLGVGVSKIGKEKTEVGEGPLQGYYDDVMATMGRDNDFDAPLSGLRRLAPWFPSPPMKGVGNVIVGQAWWQKPIRDAEEELMQKEWARALRGLGSSARIAGAIEE